MWRALFVLGLLLAVAAVSGADINPSSQVNGALVQIQDCFDVQLGNAARVSGMYPTDTAGGSGLSLRALAATLGIGLLSILFFVPAALLSEFFIRRGDTQPGQPTV